MTGDTDTLNLESFSAAGVDRAGELTLGQIRAGCRGRSGADFASKTGAALEAVLALVAAEPELARYLFGFSDLPAVRERQVSWRETFAAELRTAAAQRATPSSAPPLRETFLIMGVGDLALRNCERGEADRLPGLVPELLILICAHYYPSPAAARAAVEASAERPDPSSSR